MTLVAFDFDGTLSNSEMTILLGNRCGVADEMERITERAMNDEIEYARSLRERCALLEGLPNDEALAAFDEVVLREGASEVLHSLNNAAVHTAILTGGFERGVEAALKKAGASVDDIVANWLPVANGALTGEVKGPLIEGTKDNALEDLATAQNVAMAETVAIGDGANDRPMLEIAGLSIGFDPKPTVVPACDVIVETMAELGEVLNNHDVIPA